MRLAQARGYPESRGGHAGLPLESPTEVALVREPGGEGDPGEHTGAPTGVASGPLRVGSAPMLPPMSLSNDCHLRPVNADRRTGTIKPGVGISRSNLVSRDIRGPPIDSIRL